jgi:hypothetical protein
LLGGTLDIWLNEHKKSVIKMDLSILKLPEHVIDTNHRILGSELKVIGHKSHWKARKLKKAVEVYRRGDMVIRSPNFDINPVWLPLIIVRNIKLGIQPKMPLMRRSA